MNSTLPTDAKSPSQSACEMIIKLFRLCAARVRPTWSSDSFYSNCYQGYSYQTSYNQIAVSITINVEILECSFRV